jgi:capsular polysaccharide transport system permease protein
VTWIDAVLARFLLNLITDTVIFVIVIAGIMLIADTHVILDPPRILTGLAMATLIGLGVGLINCLLIGYAPVWEQIWAIINRPLFIASGVFFLYEDLPPLVQDILWWNPLIHAVSEVRKGFYASYQGDFISLSYGFGVALGLIALGLVLLRRGYIAGLER